MTVPREGLGPSLTGGSYMPSISEERKVDGVVKRINLYKPRCAKSPGPCPEKKEEEAQRTLLLAEKEESKIDLGEVPREANGIIMPKNGSPRVRLSGLAWNNVYSCLFKHMGAPSHTRRPSWQRQGFLYFR